MQFSVGPKVVPLERRLARIVERAEVRYQSSVGYRISHDPVVRLGGASSFGAWTGGSSIELASGTIFAIDKLWLSASSRVGSAVAGQTAEAQKTAGRHGTLADLSLEWLVLHEMMHGQLGHLPLLGVARLVEIDHNANATKNASVRRELRQHLSKDELPKLRRCLELQADDEATDVMFGPFPEADWQKLRLKSAAIVAVMALIERENARRGSPGRTHPRASTRFFLLVAKLFQYWLYDGAHLEREGDVSRVRTPTSPDPALLRRYSDAVLGPAIEDAIALAEAAGAESLIADLTRRDLFLSDIFNAQYGPDLCEETFYTDAAKEWAELLPINEKIMVMTGLRQWG